jgi:hypothetical protein
VPGILLATPEQLVLLLSAPGDCFRNSKGKEQLTAQHGCSNPGAAGGAPRPPGRFAGRAVLSGGVRQAVAGLQAPHLACRIFVGNSVSGIPKGSTGNRISCADMLGETS